MRRTCPKKYNVFNVSFEFKTNWLKAMTYADYPIDTI